MSASTQSAIDLSGIECWRDKVRHDYVGQTDAPAADTVRIKRVRKKQPERTQEKVFETDTTYKVKVSLAFWDFRPILLLR
jgi:hypothetical protein